MFAQAATPVQTPGGFKLWEGAVDLAAYIAREHKLLAADVITGTPAESGLDVSRVWDCGPRLGPGRGRPWLLFHRHASSRGPTWGRHGS
jgi:hypothetical protein